MIITIIIKSTINYTFNFDGRLLVGHFLFFNLFEFYNFDGWNLKKH